MCLARDKPRGVGYCRLPAARRRLGIELIRGSASASAVATLLERGLIEFNQHHLFVTTRAEVDRLQTNDAYQYGRYRVPCCLSLVSELTHLG